MAVRAAHPRVAVVEREAGRLVREPGLRERRGRVAPRAGAEVGVRRRLVTAFTSAWGVAERARLLLVALAAGDADVLLRERKADCRCVVVEGRRPLGPRVPVVTTATVAQIVVLQ